MGDTYLLSTGPCPPRDVRVKASCEDHSALVSWTPSPVAETYRVVAMAADGHMHTCNTTFSNCSVSELHCNQRYTVYVTASHENCTSKCGQNTTLNTGICSLSFSAKNTNVSTLAQCLLLLYRTLPTKQTLCYFPLYQSVCCADMDTQW